MKKLTAGIFTVLMGLVSVNAADAAVASKGYVDNKFFTIEAQTQHVAAQKTTDDAQDAKINKNITDIATNAGAIATNAEKIGDATFTDDALKYIKGEANLAAAVKKLDAAVTVASGDLSNVYTKTEADNKFIDTDEITGYATGAELDNVSDVADAADILSKANKNAITLLNSDANTDGSVAKKIKDATTTVTNEYKEADALTLDAAKGYTDEEIAKINNADTGILKLAKDYADAEVKKLADGAVATNTGAIAKLDGDVTVEGSVKKLIQDATTTVTNAYTTADTAILNTANAYTDEQIQALDLQAISRVPAACGNAGNYCVLTTNGTKFVWEVIVREDTTLGEGDTGLYESTVTQ